MTLKAPDADASDGKAPERSSFPDRPTLPVGRIRYASGGDVTLDMLEEFDGRSPTDRIPNGDVVIFAEEGNAAGSVAGRRETGGLVELEAMR